MSSKSTSSLVRLTGFAALAHAERHGLALCKHADPIEGAREGLSVDEAKRVANGDAELIYLDAPVVYRVAPRDSQDWDLAGAGNEFSTADDAYAAAVSLDETCPLDDGNEWCIYECEPGCAPFCLN